MSETLTDLPTPHEAWEYLLANRGLRNAAPRIHVRFKDDGMMSVYVTVSVPRRKVDGSPSKQKRLITGTPEGTVESAIISAALAVKHYLAVTFGEVDQTENRSRLTADDRMTLGLPPEKP